MRRRRRYYGVQSTARAAAVAPYRPGEWSRRWAPPGMSAEERKRFRAYVTKQIKMYERQAGRKLTIGEIGIVRRSVASDWIRRQSDMKLAFEKTPAAPVSRRQEKSLMFGRGKGGSGSSGLTGTLRRRQHRSVGRNFRLVKPKWIDPFPQIPGTTPEKIIFAALVERHIYFIFHGTPDDFDDKSLLDFYAPTLHDFDFLLPEYRVVIDPYSEFHHSQADSIKRDILRGTILGAMYWAYYHPWSHEVEDRGGQAILDDIEELKRPPVSVLTSEKDKQAKAAQGYRLGAALGTGAFSVGIANRKRRKAPSLRLR